MYRANGGTASPAATSSFKCVFVGDAGVGKTSLVVAYTTNGFCERYTPTTFDNYSVSVTVDNKPIKIEFSDTAGRSEFDSLRLLSYNEASVFLLCFSVLSQASLQSVITKWLPEVRSLAPDVPVILVATQSDLRQNMSRLIDLKRRGLSAVDPKQIRKLAEQQHMELIECSALTKHNLKEVFDIAILNALSRSKKRAPHISTTPAAEKQRAPTSIKESFRKLVTMTRRLI